MANRDPDPTTTVSGQRLVAAGPVLALVVFAALVALAAVVAVAIGWSRSDMLVAAAGAGAGVAAIAMLLLYRQTREQQATDRALQNVEARVSGIVESAMDPVVAVDENQRIILFNAAAEQIFRWPRSAVLGKSLDMLVPERFRPQHRDHIERFGRTGVTSRRMGGQTVLMALRANGEEFPIEASISQHSEDRRKFFTVILRDISERARAERLLARSEARLRGILDSAMDAIITVNESQHVVLFNAAAEAMFGCPRDQALGVPLESFIPDRFRRGHAEHVRRFAETGTTSRRMGALRIVTGLRRNGEEFPIDASISQLGEQGSKLFTVILRDVTERVRAEEALRRFRQELQELAAEAQMAREQEKSRVARELHDELAQALTGLKMDVAWIAERLPDQDDAVGKKLQRVEILLDQAVAATRRIAAELRPLILDDLGLVPAVEWLVQNFIQKTGVPCDLAIDDPELELEDIHATAVFRILQESLTNVAKHAKASRVQVRIEHANSNILFSVRDDGVGFSPQAPRLPHSLGLAGVRERSQLLGGEVRILSAPGEGATIEVRLPVQS